MKYDVLIIGAGLAGCACARLLAHSGLKTLAIDRANLATKDKLCGGLLTPRAVRALERLYGTDVRRIYACEHKAMRVMVASHDRVLDGVSVVGTRRADLDRYVLEQARKAGADILDRTRVGALDIPRGKAVLQTPDGSIEVEFDTLVAADGAVSTTRAAACRQYESCLAEDSSRDADRACGYVTERDFSRTEPTGHQPRREPRFARPVKAEVIPSLEAQVNPISTTLSGKYDAHLHGYGWYIPCGEGGNIGFDGKTSTTRAELQAALDAFAAEMGVAVDATRLRGAFIPSGGTVLLQLGGPGVMASIDGRWPRTVYLIGDAAGLAAPATGEGIYFALQSAEQLARCLTRNAASYRSLMSSEAATLERQYRMLSTLFNEDLMERSMSLSHVSGIGPDRMARFALKLFASF